MTKFKAAIIGCGAIYDNHAQALANSEYAELYAVCDIIPQRADKAAHKYGCKAYYNFDDIINDKNVDSVHICTPHFLHAPMITAAADAGKKIVVEKPMVMNVHELEQIQTSAEKTDVCSILQNRFCSCILKAKELIDSGIYGQLLGAKGFITWHRDAEYYHSGEWRSKWATEGGGLVINQCLHTLDLLAWICGEPDSIKASIDTRVLGNVIEVEDTAEATIYMKNGILAHFYGTNNYSTSSAYDMEFHLECGMLKYMYDKLYFIKDNTLTYICKNDTPENKEKGYWGTSHSKLINNFYSSLSGNKANYTDFNDGTLSVKLVDALYKSVKSGKKIKL